MVGSTSFRDIGLFVGVLLLFLMAAGVLVIAAEIRTPWMRRKLLVVRVGLPDVTVLLNFAIF